MHCLGAVTDLSSGKVNISPGGNRGNVLSVVQALGVLVCEGRIQGSSRGYKEGPHCSVPLQTVPSNHVCDNDNYLCNRYLVLIKEIADRVDIGANLCIEVFMCSDCPCGHAKASCNNIISSISSTLISQWPHSSEILLEYWRIGVLPSKSSEMMNPLALYQAVRSRLHFSQVAAWWSRSNGTKPAYVATRIIPHNADNLRNFRETPIEHTFPLVAIGDGNSVNVTVWALPRIKDVPTFICPIHQSLDLQEEENGARAVTPTKSVVSSRLDVGLVLPSLVDDRLQTPCDKSGKHHCNCEDEDGCPPSPCIKPNGERKRRRSLPCGPPDASSSSIFNNVPLMSVIETNSSNVFRDAETSFADTKQSADVEKFNTRSYASTSTFERCFKTQVKLTLEASECYDEKRYKPSLELLAAEMKSYVNNTAPIGSNKFKSFVPFVESRDLGMSGILNFDATKPDSSQEKNDHPSAVSTKTNVVVNPLAEHISFYEPNCGPSTFFKSSL
ncbi:hypothetical protein G9C98_004925 [Cotesia typhae]|uniref:Uncharacterized protein n=2 Tax=Cotesia typhae TaxID=2053667 RepID=A0A8J5RJ53_9HYME|nr:hypothetical protein G9C98_004925 [Cotesia typhae]